MLFNLFSSSKQPKPGEVSENWIKCTSCGAMLFQKEAKKEQYVCNKCGFHMRLSSSLRIEYLVDEKSFVEHDKNLVPCDPLKFTDKKSYTKRLYDANRKTGLDSAAVAGSCTIDGVPLELVVFDFGFMGGSLGSVEGEKVVRAINRAIKKRTGLVIFSSSGGARMQESIFSLMQMAKTSAALAKLDEANLPYISVLTYPTMGGVSASFAMLGDLIIAEPAALVGFAGARVIQQTIGGDLPDGFQSAEFLLEHGSIDMIVSRKDLKKTIGDFLVLFDTNRS